MKLLRKQFQKLAAEFMKHIQNAILTTPPKLFLPEIIYKKEERSVEDTGIN